MVNEQELRQIYTVVLACWKFFKRHAVSEKDWDAIVGEATHIWNESGQDKVAQHIIFGFVDALEEIEKRERS